MKVEGWLAGALLSVATACSYGNTGQVGIPDSLVAAVPWTNGAVALRDSMGNLVTPNEPVFPPIGAGTPDPGSRPIDCSPLANIELSPFSIMTFEAAPSVCPPGQTCPNLCPAPAGQTCVGIGEAFSSYDDGTYGAFRVTGDASWYPGLVGRYSIQSGRFGLAADRITNGPSCDGQPNDWAMHVRGGRFDYYGAGMEYPLGAIVPCPPGSDFCPPPPAPNAMVDSVGFPLKAPSGKDYAQPAPHQYWDLSHYDGVTLWARVGPDGGDGLLVALQDKFTSDALNRQNNTFCRRIKTCVPDCQNHAPCTAVDPQAPRPTYRCFYPPPPPMDPAQGMAPNLQPAEIEMIYPVCGPSACRSPDYYYDPDFDNRLEDPTGPPLTECKPYEFSGLQAGYYCYGSEPPPDKSTRCEDGWVTSIHLTTDWQIYVIPFTEFRQVGFGRPAPYMDLHSIYEVALEFPVGLVDVYVDNITFYRRR